ncbi:PepSY domain-containing protein [Thalassobellus suaedae]|uniref:PepSY-associated TM helix domain-containing protein n=1 Tax=Thalassobellus suaedae TaxID=3074124 RepID=A0ABY9XYE3_9FLAO|nr:PepSY-associated TM helix domain-containing protein [Flavobacteriaceae bacterium HL-DH14]
MYFFTPLFVIAFTGAYFTYNTFYKSALKFFDEFKNTQVNETIKTSEDFLEFSDVLNNSNETYALRAIYFPKDSTSDYRFRYIKDRFIIAGFRKTKEVELSLDGKKTTLSNFKFDTNSKRIAAQFYPIHIGEIAGLFGRVLVFISGLVPILLFITGFKVYKAKGKRA